MKLPLEYSAAPPGRALVLSRSAPSTERQNGRESLDPSPSFTATGPFGRLTASLAAVAIVALAALPLLISSPAVAQCPGEGSCLEPQPTPGCSNEACCENVCLFESSCCDVAWDVNCVTLADIFCEGLCGSSAAGSCFSINQNPGCDDAECCDTVCPLDPFCCETLWDGSCVALATFLCSAAKPGECGDPTAGSCFTVHSAPACSDASCCEAVCTLSPSCCTAAWDFVCVSLANQVCITFCDVNCPKNAIDEIEECAAFSNDPCFATVGGVPQSIACGTSVCGAVVDGSALGEAPDVDVYSIAVTGKGAQRLVVAFTAAFEGFVALMPSSCGDLADAIAFVEGGTCVPQTIDACVEPGTYWLVVAPGAFPTPGGEFIQCGDPNEYRLDVSCVGFCGPVCGVTDASCFLPHDGIGCDDEDCCAATCMVDPSCCDTAWDAICAAEASDLCGAPPAPNDACASCTAIGTGEHPFSTVNATQSDLPLPASCDEGSGLSFAADVWFCYDATCDGLTVFTTCPDATYDTRMAVYVGGCDGLELVACNDDTTLCLFTERSRVAINAVCGETYYIRIGGFATAVGVGVLEIDCGFSPECPTACVGDIDGNGVVDGADLGILLQSWFLSGPADLNGDGFVDGADLGLLLTNWGPCR